MDTRYTIRKAQLLEDVRSPLRSSSRLCPACGPFWHPLSTPCRGKPLGRMPRPMSEACCRMSNARTWNRSPIILARSAWGCKVLSAGMTGTMPPCDTRCGPSGPAIGTSRWRVGLRSLGLSQVRARIGRRGPAVVRSLGESRQLSSGHLLGLRLRQRPHPGGHAVVSTERLDPR